jgi:uncharacterized membrane protein YbaN (DUF454 family)
LNPAEAKQILLLYRPGTCDAEDPEILAAMELARRDPELGKWFEQQKVFQSSIRAKFRQIEVPARLKAELLADRKVIHPHVFWQRPVWLAAAAIFVLLLGLVAVLLRPSLPDRFANYRENMVSAAVRVYGMDLETNDKNQLRQFIAQKGAPADYELTQGLERLQLRGGGLLRWRGNPVSMVCFDRGGNNMLFLFVVKRSALKDPPPLATSEAELAKVDGLMTASWTRGDDAYVLAGAEEPRFAEKYATSH